jgi:hypothetical protein
MTKATLSLLTIVGSMFTMSAATFAQNYVAYPQARYEAKTMYGQDAPAFRAPLDRFTRSDFGYAKSRGHTKRYYSSSYERGGCLPDQERSNRTGYCRPARSQQ